MAGKEKSKNSGTTWEVELNEMQNRSSGKKTGACPRGPAARRGVLERPEVGKPGKEAQAEGAGAAPKARGPARPRETVPSGGGDRV